ncbi:DUF535 family protein [Undibacterium parvum]|nr:DUF535 family protein [Undibacterium parvum]
MHKPPADAAPSNIQIVDIHHLALSQPHPLSLFTSSALRPVSLYTGVNQSQRGLSYLRETIKISLRAVFSYPTARLWIALWNSSPFHKDLALANPSILKKIFRPYLSRQLTCGARLELVYSHYALIAQQQLGDLVLAAAKAPVTLSQFTGKSGAIYQLELLAATTMEREGELVLQLRNGGHAHDSAQDSVLFSVAFTFFSRAGTSGVAIGCLQGGREPNSLEQIRVATKDMYGLRPKTLLVRLVQQLGLQLQCEDLLLVGNKNRVVTQPLKKGKVFADYDASWQELQAEPRADGDFRLPCVALAEPDMASIPSHKRSEAKKRFGLLSSISQSTCESFFAQDPAQDFLPK